MVDLAAVILAAGKSTRMKSALPKVLHPIAGRPVLRYVVDLATNVGAQRTVVVVGNQSEAVRDELGGEVEYAEQREQLGTGHALLQAKDLMDGCAKTVLVLCGDMPLVSASTLRRLVERQLATGASVTVLTATVDDPSGLGRIVRDGIGQLERIVEDKEANEAEKAIREVNTGVYCFRSDWIWPQLGQLPRSSVGEFYLTDTIAMARASGTVESVLCDDAVEALGINNRIQLVQAEAVVRQRVSERLMLEGVSIVDPKSTRIDEGVTIGPDTVVFPGSAIEGRCQIGKDCKIGPNTVIRESILGNGVEVVSSFVEGTAIADGAIIGPFARIGCKVGKTGNPHAGKLSE